MTEIHQEAGKRHDFVVLFDVADGNPNGDPDAGNLPRVDPETMEGLVTDVALKRKVRDWIDASHGAEPRNKIYVQRDTYLTETRKRVFSDHKARDKTAPAEARAWMCEEFFDIRMFGAVMSMKEKNAGQVRGPMQLTFARSVDPIIPLDVSIARVALETTTEKAADTESELEAPTHGTLGRKTLVPYGLYRGSGFFNPFFAEQTGASDEDLGLFWQALQMMWDLDRSSSRGLMACRGIYIFTHESKLGNAPAHSLLESVSVKRHEGVDVPRTFGDYDVKVSDAALPEGVTLTVLGA